MSDTSKQIRISVAVDEQSARKAKGMVDDLTRSVERLTQSASRINMGSVLGGSSGAVTMSTKRLGPGGISPMATPGGRGAQGGIIGSVLGMSDPATLRGLVSGTENAFRQVTSGLRTFTDRAIGDIERLSRAIATLQRSVGGAGGGGGLPLNLPGPSTAPMFEGLAAPPAGGGGGGGRGRGGGARGGGGAGAGGQGVINFMGGIQSLIRGDIGGFIGSSAGRAGGIAAAGYAGWRVGEAINQSMVDDRTARVGFTLNSPFETIGRKAAMAQPFLGAHGAAVGRDAAMMVAYGRATNDRDVRKSLESTSLRREMVELTKMGAGTATGTLKNLLNDVLGGKRTSDDAYAFINGMQVDQTTKQTARDLIRRAGQSDLGPEAAAQIQQAAQGIRATMDPTQAMMLNEVYGNAAGRVGAMRSMGMTTGDVRLPDGTVMSRFERMTAKLGRGGWNMGDYAAGRQQLLGAGLGYSSQVGPIGIVSAGVGGLSNAAGLMQLGGTMRGSAQGGGNMVGTAQRSIGAGGLDVAVGRELFQRVAQQAMQTGQYGGTNLAATSAAMQAGLISGGDVGEQQRLAYMLQAGGPTFAAMSAGRTAPLYNATSLMGGISAMGGYGGGAEALRRSDPSLLAAAVRDKSTPRWMTQLGIGLPEAEKFLQYQRRAPLFEVVDELVGGKAGETLAKVRAAESTGGSFMDVAMAAGGERGQGETANQYNRRRAQAARGVASDLGAAMFASGLAESPEAGAGVFLGIEAQDARLSPFLKGGGVGAAAPQGAEAAALEKQAQATEHLGKAAAKLESTINDLNPTKIMQGAETAIKGISGMDTSTMDGSVDMLVAALNAFRRNIDKASGGGQRKTTGK